MTSYLISYGVWQGALAILNPYFSTYYSDIVMGTHVGNPMQLTLASYAGGVVYDFASSFFDITYNLSTCETYTETYLETYGVTYAATYYRDIACNVSAVYWI